MRFLLAAAAFSTALFVGACGGGGGGGGATSSTTGAAGGTTASTTVTTTTITSTSSGIGGAGSVKVFFLEGEHLKPVQRSVAKQAPAKGAMLQLLQGPGTTGLTTQIPAGTTLRSVHIEDGVARVDLSKAFESGGGSLSMQERVAQVLYTLTQFSSASAVRFYVEGKPVTALGGEGLLLDKPVTRADFSQFAPVG